MIEKIVCDKCGWSWRLKDGGKDPYLCHRCGNKVPEPVAEEMVNKFSNPKV
jgi:tRNA(Ile2) C34 agmatinyltransferase TiaS